MDPQTVHTLKHLKVVKDPIYGLITQFVCIEIARLQLEFRAITVILWVYWIPQITMNP